MSIDTLRYILRLDCDAVSETSSVKDAGRSSSEYTGSGESRVGSAATHQTRANNNDRGHTVVFQVLADRPVRESADVADVAGPALL